MADFEVNPRPKVKRVWTAITAASGIFLIVFSADRLAKSDGLSDLFRAVLGMIFGTLGIAIARERFKTGTTDYGTVDHGTAD